MVENDEADYAYFGDLNARLAIRSGASGAIINGATRDRGATQELNFPVFAKGYNAMDVRRRATLDYINKPLHLNGITVNPGDLIFADDCSIVVIYQKYEKEIIARVLETLKNEKDIINDIFKGEHIAKIISDRGAF